MAGKSTSKYILLIKDRPTAATPAAARPPPAPPSYFAKQMEDEETEQMEEYELMSSTSHESSFNEDSCAEYVTECEIRYVERPPDDFFCPVTFELLLEPQQTSCCGNHLSLGAATRLHEEGQRCPLEEWSVVLDKYHRRKVHEVRVRCPYEEQGCEWESEVRGLYEHAHLCSKQPWECEYCKFSCTLEEGVGEHWPICPNFPELCPNGCAVGTVERRNMEEHRSVCSMELVTCEMSEFGCSAMVPRKELATHMQDGENQHVISVTLLNNSLCRQLQEDVTDMDTAIAQLQRESTLHKQLHTEMQIQMQSDLKKTMNDLKSAQRELQLQVGELKQIQTDMKGRLLHEQKQLQTKLIDEQKTMKTEITHVQRNMQTELMDELRTTHVRADTRATVEGHTHVNREVMERMSEQITEIMRNVNSQRRELTELKEHIQVVQQNVEQQSTSQCPHCCLQ